jgi:hypothetical protein
MATQYLHFANATLAQNQSQADWAQKILRHPTLSTSTTKAFWGWIVNPDTGDTYGVFTDAVMDYCTLKYTPQQLSDLQATLIPEDDPGVAATLAAIAAAAPT